MDTALSDGKYQHNGGITGIKLLTVLEPLASNQSRESTFWDIVVVAGCTVISMVWEMAASVDRKLYLL